MECWICQKKYHVIECEGPGSIPPSFLKHQWPSLVKNWPSITFTCNLCKEDMKTKQDVIMSQRVRLLEESSLKTAKRFDDIMEILTSIQEKPTAPAPNEKPTTYSSMAAKDTPSVIVIEKPESEQEQSVADTKAKMETVKIAAIQSKVALKKSFTNRSGQTVFVCNNDKAKETLLPHIKEAFVSTGRKITTPKPRLPTISVPYIDGEYDKTELLTALRNQNEDEGILFDAENTNVVFIGKMRDPRHQGLYQAVIRVSESIRERIKVNGNRVFIGSSSCPVFDRFFIKRCNRCQRFHHFQKDNGGCKKDEVCALCTGNHDTRGCSQDPEHYRCVNCEHAEMEDFWHAADSIHCHSYIAEQEKLRKTINYYQKNQ